MSGDTKWAGVAIEKACELVCKLPKTSGPLVINHVGSGANDKS